LVEFADAIGAIIIGTFVGSDYEVVFPPVECMATVRAVEFCFWLPQGFVESECLVTNFAFQLRSHFPIVEIDILIRCIAMGATDFLWYSQFGETAINGFYRFMVGLFILFKDYFIVLGRFFFAGGSVSGSVGSGQKFLKLGCSSLNSSRGPNWEFVSLRMLVNSVTIASTCLRLNREQIHTTNFVILVIGFFYLLPLLWCNIIPQKRGEVRSNRLRR